MNRGLPNTPEVDECTYDCQQNYEQVKCKSNIYCNALINLSYASACLLYPSGCVRLFFCRLFVSLSPHFVCGASVAERLSC